MQTVRLILILAFSVLPISRLCGQSTETGIFRIVAEKNGQTVSGSSVLLDVDDEHFYLATCFHVLNGSSSFEVIVPGSKGDRTIKVEEKNKPIFNLNRLADVVVIKVPCSAGQKELLSGRHKAMENGPGIFHLPKHGTTERVHEKGRAFGFPFCEFKSETQFFPK